MSEQQQEQDPENSFRDSINSVDQQGKRIWIYPKMPKGRFYDYRKWLSYVLLIILFGMPWIKINGDPFMQFDILNRQFIVFGVHFVPQDFHLFVIATLIFMIFIVLFTVIFGRVFCGWICPQTIFMEMVYRRIEYAIEGDYTAQKRLNKAPWTWDKIWKKTLKQSLFFGIAFLVGNTFLAYIIGVDDLMEIISSPIAEHWQGFSAMLIFSLIFYFVFSQLREQVCTTICPYGRLQGVMLDKQSLAVYYDWVRGEPRGRIKRNATELELEQQGDCIDCGLCVKVCPTGIDIRNGIQLECVNCTACMDACDEVMEKVDRPKGLIRIDSHAGIESKKHKLFNPRSIAYSLVLTLLIGIELFLFVSRSDVETVFLRTPGKLYYEREAGVIENLYNYQLINKTEREMPVEFVLQGTEGEIEYVGQEPTTIPNGTVNGSVFVKIPRDELDSRSTEIRIQVVSDGEVLERLTTNFLGPIK
jgi:cytochrome c oxidase accessory protein FixG